MYANKLANIDALEIIITLTVIADMIPELLEKVVGNWIEGRRFVNVVNVVNVAAADI